MNLSSLLYEETRSPWPPFRRRRRSRLDTLRDMALERARRTAERALDGSSTATERARVVAGDAADRAKSAGATAAERARELPVPGAAVAGPAVGRAATAVAGKLPSVTMLPIEKPAFLQDGLPLDRLPGLRRRKKGRWQRVREAETPTWMILLAIIAGFGIGIGIGMALTNRRSGAARGGLDQAADEIKAAWPEVTDNDIEDAQGSAERLADVIRARTGENAATVRTLIEGMANRGHAGSQRNANGLQTA
jgi:uncharacterized protein YjbJ (UPF0337 family)